MAKLTIERGDVLDDGNVELVARLPQVDLGAAEGDECELPRVPPALDGHPAYLAGHLRVRHLQHVERGRLDRLVQGLGDGLPEPLAGPVHDEVHVAGDERLRGEPPEQEVRIGHRRLDDALGTTGLALAHYRLAPGERFSRSLHTHRDQSELFVVLDGTATFEWRPTADATSETVTVGAGEAVRFAAGEFQSGYNDGSVPAVALAVGVPRETESLEVVCPDCGHGAAEPVLVEGRERLRCVECGGTFDVDEAGGGESG